MHNYPAVLHVYLLILTHSSLIVYSLILCNTRFSRFNFFFCLQIHLPSLWAQNVFDNSFHLLFTFSLSCNSRERVEFMLAALGFDFFLFASVSIYFACQPHRLNYENFFVYRYIDDKSNNST